ncbi:olfactory receptor 1E16-like [Ascaphus truei]|uniref:olfactory receptor 1E16-like n=1 Tax=Ascaphus truei TaxID=8439 RepID=UPI003F59CD10
MANQSDVFEFVLIGFPGLPRNFHSLVSAAMFLIYNISLFANGTVIILIILKEQLHQSMYVIIANLALSDLLFDTITLPKIIATYWFGAGSMSFYSCIFQLYCVHFLGTVDSFIIMLMAVDRYVAICQPLRYSSIISNKLVAILCSFSWVFAALISSAVTALAAQLPYCGPNKVKNCFCLNSAVTVLACVDTTSVRRIAFTLAMFVLLLPLAFIIFSYIIIIKTIHSSAHSENWQKAFYTCTTHLFVIGLYFVPRVFVYISSQVRLILNADLNVLLLCLYTFVPHVANPIIYCLRTKEIKSTLGNVFKRKISLKIKDRHLTM